MSSFTTPLVVTPMDDGHTWQLVEAFDYMEGNLQGGSKIEVPKGFITDFASIPQLVWNILPPWGRYGKAAVLHDFLYATAPFSRKRCDDILLEAMGVLGVSWLARWTIYSGVRVGGWVAWRGHRAQETAGRQLTADVPENQPAVVLQGKQVERLAPGLGGYNIIVNRPLDK